MSDEASAPEQLVVNFIALLPLTVGVQIPLVQSIDASADSGAARSFFGSLRRFAASHGAAALWRGHVAFWLHDACATRAKAALRRAVRRQALAAPPTAGYLLATALAADVGAALLLAPLDLVRTRLMAQSTDPHSRKYANPVDALLTIASEEGWSALYNSKTMVPRAILETVLSIDQFGIPLFLVQVAGLDPVASPLVYKSVRFAMGMTLSLITLPLETVINRMQSQVVPKRGTKIARFRTCVPTDQVPYKDMHDCIDRVVREEEVALKKRDKKGTGRSALYRAWQGAFMANLFVALFQDSFDVVF
ncbi:mitochondrial carrier domain-containing protein [Obelidium mucronatum]|nr:mitochondrial carrier domain-containing protein [Obelidium mucronatum]